MEEGGKGSLCIRAEDIRVEKTVLADDFLSFDAEVVHIIFQGSAKLVEFEVGGQRLTAKLDHEFTADIGERVGLAVQKGQYRIVDGLPPGENQDL